jgi:GT2 family glycosyltransferase
MKILAIIVTYNRCELLARCVEHVQSQSLQPDEILVINNGSTDNTEAMLKARGVTIITQANLGAASGWHRGIEYALEHGCEAVWLMDDDGFPETSALAALKPRLVPGVACASSVVLREDQRGHFVFPFPVLNKAGMPALFGSHHRLITLDELRSIAPNGVYPFAHLFNGALISIAAIKLIGNVDREYFIYGDEVDFFFRLRKVGAVISVLDAIHFHPDVSGRPYNAMKVYYYVRNSLVLNGRYYEHAWVRHGFVLLLILLRLFKRNGPGFVLSLLAGARSDIFYKAVSRGLEGKLGKDFQGSGL